VSGVVRLKGIAADFGISDSGYVVTVSSTRCDADTAAFFVES